LRINKPKILLAGALLCILWMASCGGPVGGYMVSLTLNGERFEYPQARVYIEKADVYRSYDGTVSYTILPEDAEEFSHLLFTLVAGEWGQDPVFIMTWLADVYEVPQVAGKNFAVSSIKIFPNNEKYEGIPSALDYSASFNMETCYIVTTITQVNVEANWINGILNGVYVEQVGDMWWRMEIRDGRFGAGYRAIAVGAPKQLPDREDEG